MKGILSYIGYFPVFVRISLQDRALLLQAQEAPLLCLQGGLQGGHQLGQVGLSLPPLAGLPLPLLGQTARLLQLSVFLLQRAFQGRAFQLNLTQPGQGMSTGSLEGVGTLT